MGLGRPHPFWRSGSVRRQGGIVVFHHIYPLRLERFQSARDLTEPRTLPGKPEVLKASDKIMALLLVATSLLEWLGGSVPLLNI